jgi:hypothetical protein
VLLFSSAKFCYAMCNKRDFRFLYEMKNLYAVAQKETCMTILGETI